MKVYSNNRGLEFYKDIKVFLLSNPNQILYTPEHMAHFFGKYKPL